MSDISTSLKQYPRPDKRTRSKKIESLTLAVGSSTQVPEKKVAKSELEVDNFIKAHLKLVSRSNIERWINSLTSFHNRHSKSIYIHQAANWLKKELEISGYKNKEETNDQEDGIYFHSFKEEGFEMRNVICSKKGKSNKYVLLCGHYDTILGDNVEDTVSRAPRANDNASGVAAILEIARILFPIDLKYGIRFVFFSGEEQGLRGSEHYSELITDKNEDLALVINLDMIGQPGLPPTNKTVQIDVDKKFKGKPSCNVTKGIDEASDNYATIMQKMAINYTNLDGQKGSAFASDYCPFEARGYVIIGAYDGSAEPENPHYHHASDVPDNLDMEFLTSVTKMILATILDIIRKNSFE